MYVRIREYWGPGETLPRPDNTLHSGTGPLDKEPGSVVDVLNVFQANLEKQIGLVCSKLESIDSRMDLLETRQKSLEEEIKANHSISSESTCSPGASTGSRRQRVTPTAMQV